MAVLEVEEVMALAVLEHIKMAVLELLVKDLLVVEDM
jgi:hypothetical protein